MKENKDCGRAVQETEVDRYFNLKRDIIKSEETLVKLSGEGLFIDEFKPAIHMLRGMVKGMEITERAFDL